MTATLVTPVAAFATTTVGGTGASGPEYLRRSAYAERIGHGFTVGGHVLTLAAVDDVAGAELDESLRGHQAAFSLRFTGPADALPSALHELRHDVLGPFPLFLGPVGNAVGRTQQYHAVVDRTIRVSIAATPESPALNPPPPPERPPPSAKEDLPKDDDGGPGEVGGDAAPSPPTQRDLEILEERAVAHRDARVRRRRRTRRARHRLRRAHAERTSFLRKQRMAARKRSAKIRRGWLRRHGV